MSPEDWSPSDSIFDGSGWKRSSITRGGEYRPGTSHNFEASVDATEDYQMSEDNNLFRNSLEDVR